MVNTSFANEIEQGDRLMFRQTFRVADDSGLLISGSEIVLDGTWSVESDAEYAGLDSRGRETVTFTIRPSGCGLLHKVVVPSARVIRLA